MTEIQTQTETFPAQSLRSGTRHHASNTPVWRDDDEWCSSRQVRERYGNISDMTIWRWIRAPVLPFPRPLMFNGRNRWRLGDLRAWESAVAAAARKSK